MSRENEIMKLLASSSKVVGTKQVLRGISEGTIGCVIVAEDADCALKSRVVGAAECAGIAIACAPSMAWLGKAAGIEVGAAAVGIGTRED